jgi:hypothetical protein
MAIDTDILSVFTEENQRSIFHETVINAHPSYDTTLQHLVHRIIGNNHPQNLHPP